MRLLPLLALTLGFLQLQDSDPQWKHDLKGLKLAKGVVFHDVNNNGIRDKSEPGVADVRVSNGWEVVTTDGRGKWKLPIPDYDNQGIGCEFFVIKPQGWMVPVGENLLPQHYYVHRPIGSPGARKNYGGRHYAGSPATGKLPTSINFPLIPQEESDELRVLMYGDPQPRNLTEVSWMEQDVVEECKNFDGSFGMALGDVAFDDLSIFPDIASALAVTGIPWWMVLGNHDINFDALSDSLANETFIANFGPANYSFDWGPAHFLILDDVHWVVPNKDDAENPSLDAHYEAQFSEAALAFAKNDLALVPKDRLVVAAMHIPLKGVANGEVLLKELAAFNHSVSVSGHTHTQRVDELGVAHGWPKDEPHSHVVHVTACGSWWTGQKDERGIPHTTMRDGAPNGWLEWTFTDGAWKFDFRAAGRDADEKMHVVVGEPTHEPPHSLDGFVFEDLFIPVWVNVWSGDRRSKVEARLSGTETWITLNLVSEADPAYAAILASEEKIRNDKWRKMPDPIDSTHLWFTNLSMPPVWDGPLSVEVRVTDRWGRVSRHRSR